MSTLRSDVVVGHAATERIRELVEANDALSRELADLRRALDTRELDFQLIVESIPVPVAVTSPSGAVEALNRATLDYFGLTLEELKRWQFLDVIHPDDRERTIAAHDSNYAAARSYSIETRLRRADGTFRWFNVVALPLRDASGAILRWFELLIDIDDRRRVEDSLRNSEACLAEAQALSSTGSFVWDTATDEHFWSLETYRIFECERAQRITRRTIEERVHVEDLPIVRNAFELAERELDVDYECRFAMPSGTLKYLRVVAHPIRDGGGAVRYVGAVQDVTKRRLADEAIREAERRYRDLQSQLAHANRTATLGQLSAWIAHDVRQPLAGVTASAEAAVRWIAADPPNLPAARRALDRIASEGQRAADVLERIAAIAKKSEPRLEAIELDALIRETTALIAPEAERKGITLRTHLSDVPAPVLADRTQLQQVLMNLAINAIQAVGLNEAAEPRELAVACVPDPTGGAVVSVSDSGPGIDPQHGERMFEAFFTTKADGLGMGLAICRTIVESFGGRIWAAENSPRGAVFSFALPVNAGGEPP